MLITLSLSPAPCTFLLILLASFPLFFLPNLISNIGFSIFISFSFLFSFASGRLSRTYNFYEEYTGEEVPEDYQYYIDEDENIIYGGWGPADYCPLPRSSSEEEAKAYYAGSCSGEESGIYGSQIIYNEEEEPPDTNEDIASITGEEISDHSFCFLSSLYKPDIDGFDYYRKL